MMHRRFSIEAYISSHPGRKATKQTYSTSLRQFEDWCSGRGVELDDVSPADVMVYLQTRRDAGLSESTVYTRLSAIKSYYSWLYAAGAIPANVLAAVRMTQPEHKLRVPLTVDQLRAIWLAAPPPVDRALIGLLLINSLRLDEICQAETGHIGEQRGMPVLNLPRRKGSPQDSGIGQFVTARVFEGIGRRG